MADITMILKSSMPVSKKFVNLKIFRQIEGLRRHHHHYAVQEK